MRPLTELRCNSRQFRTLTSLNVDEFDDILIYFIPLWGNYHKYHDLKGKKRNIPKLNEDARSSLMGTEQKLFFLLVCLKNNGLQEHNAFTFDMTQGKLCQWLKILIPILEQSLQKMEKLPARTQEALQANISQTKQQLIWLDASEREVPRPQDKDTQEATFSGKKHKNTVKNTLLVLENQEIVFLGMTQEGSNHDLKIFREDEIILPNNVILLQDLGYLGNKMEGLTIIMPDKKPKNKELSSQQKATNTIINSCRVVVEHAISGIKRIRTTLQELRMKTNQILDTIMLIACGMHNLRVNKRIKYNLS